jgi:hypothetical protein
LYLTLQGTNKRKRSNMTLERIMKLIHIRFVFNPREAGKSSVIRTNAA